ncbi:chaperonin 10-like protein [Delphinella strobiligena]|nr:chaperonin 10-like protein [Delphinella strobiligena]
MGVQDLPEKMRAIQVVEFDKPYQINTIPVPTKLAPVDILVKIGVASNCHTDGMVQHGTFGSKLPITGSHEGAGTVVAVGSDVKNFKVGSRVMCGLPYHPCKTTSDTPGHCEDCTGPEKFQQYCTNIEGHRGVHLDGFFAEYAVADSRSSTPLPDQVTLESAAPLACAGRTIWAGILEVGLKKGQWIALIGSGGGLGHLGIQFAKALGLKVIGVDARDEGLALSEEAGADVVIDARKGKDFVVQEAQKVTNGLGVDASVTISDAPDAAGLACAVTRMHRTMVQIAQPDNVSIPFAELIFRDIRIKGSLICSPEQGKSMLECVAEHGIKVKTNPFHGLDQIENLTKLVHGGKIKGKAIIIVDDDQIKHEKEIGAKY